MKYAVTLTLLGLAQIALAYMAGVWAGLLLWSGLSWMLVGFAYGGLGARVFGKRADGAMAWNCVCLLLPYLAVTWLLWHIQRLLTKELPHHEIVPGLWLGRRCSRRELPSEIHVIVDMTAEFSEPKEIRAGRTYLCVPTLDASAPSIEAFQKLIQIIAATYEPVYIHCALGHGRSATVVVAVLLARGNAVSVEQAEQMVRLVRPGIEISTAQRDLLQRWSLQFHIHRNRLPVKRRANLKGQTAVLNAPDKNLSKNPFLDWLGEVTNDPLIIDESAAGLEREAMGNLWTFSISQNQASVLTVDDVLAFLSSVTEARERQIEERLVEVNPMIFYCWFDEQASQLRFSFVSTRHKSLPFGSIVEETNDLSQVVKQFLGSFYHEGIPLEEFARQDASDEMEEAEPISRTLLVGTRVLLAPTI